MPRRPVLTSTICCGVNARRYQTDLDPGIPRPSVLENRLSSLAGGLYLSSTRGEKTATRDQETTFLAGVSPVLRHCMTILGTLASWGCGGVRVVPSQRIIESGLT